ncbi:MAG TPA: thioesterase family protein [Ignavibacteriaceae bacterium]|nr:thioesterase family protein [Ignavibacteriaceae bacterium]
MHIYHKTINFYDCDPAGIIFFSKIFEICHSAYEDFINSFRLKSNYWNNENYAVPIIHSEAEYFLPLKPADKISVEVVVNQLKDSSFELKYICKNVEGEITNEVKTVHIFIDKKVWKKIPIDPEVKDNLELHRSR